MEQYLPLILSAVGGTALGPIIAKLLGGSGTGGILGGILGGVGAHFGAQQAGIDVGSMLGGGEGMGAMNIVGDLIQGGVGGGVLGTIAGMVMKK